MRLRTGVIDGWGCAVTAHDKDGVEVTIGNRRVRLSNNVLAQLAAIIYRQQRSLADSAETLRAALQEGKEP